MSIFRTMFVPEHYVVSSREVVDVTALPEYFDRVFEQVSEIFHSAGVAPASSARGYTFSPWTDTVDLASGFLVSEGHIDAVEAAIPAGSAIQVHRIPELTVVATSHSGSYEGLAQAWQGLIDRVRGTGREIGHISWEEYVTEPAPGADPKDMITDLYLGLA